MIRFYSLISAAVLLTLSFPGIAQVLYNNGSTITITSGGSLTVRGGFTNAATSFVTNKGSFSVSGNTLNNGTISAPAVSTLRFNGTTAQTISGSSPLSAKDVEIANAFGVTLNTALNVDGAMTFTSGVITATSSTAPVIFSANGTVANTPTDASHIDGFVQKLGTGAFTFPTGDPTKYQPVGIALSANGSGMTARYYGTDAGSATFGSGGASATPLVAYNSAEYWDLAPVSTAAGTVTIYFDGYKNSRIASTSDLRVAHKTGGQWLNEGGIPSGVVSNGSVTSSSISTFSPFTLGSISSSSPLPVTLIAFSGAAEGNTSRLDWQTGMEDVGSSFSIERSANGASFESIGTVTGKGRGSRYTFYDRRPLELSAYYRLVTTDAASARAYSQVVIIRHSSTQRGGITISPVPARSEVMIQSTNKALTGTIAQVLDAQGAAVASFSLQERQILNIDSWATGMYILRLADGTAIRLNKQ